MQTDQQISPHAPSAIEAREVVKRYGDLTAVDQISFNVAYGEAFGLLGPNGAGKSTLMRMIYCRSPLTAGRLHVVGHDVNREARTIRARVGIVPQENNLDPDITVIENLLVYARYFRIPASEAAARAERLAKGFSAGLAEWLLAAAVFTPAGNFSWCCSLHDVTMADISQSASILEL